MKFSMKTPKFVTILTNFIGKVKNAEDTKTITLFVSKVAIEGIILNVALLNFGLPLTWYSWIGWGFFVWLMESKMIKMIRQVRWK